MVEIQIIKKEVVVVASKNDVNQYGDLIFHDQAGKEHKIKKTREHLFPLINLNTAVELGYGNYMNHDFIADVKPVEGELPEPQKPPVPKEGMPKEDVKAVRGDPRNRAFAVSYAKDLACKSMIHPHEILSYAKAFEAYMDGNIIVKDDDVFRVAIQHCKLREE